MKVMSCSDIVKKKHTGFTIMIKPELNVMCSPNSEQHKTLILDSVIHSLRRQTG